MIKIPQYNATVNIKVLRDKKSLTTTYNKIVKKNEINSVCKEGEFIEGAVILIDNKATILLCKESLTINTITHEVYHLTNRILGNVGVNVELESINNDENHAILNGYLNEEVFNYLHKKGWQIKKTINK